MRKNFLGTTAAALAIATAFAGAPAWASSHREAPFITSLPKADGTDFYMFRSYEAGRDGYVTFVADYQPLQAPSAAPIYYELDPQVRYNINIDNTGKGQASMQFIFQFGVDQREIALPINGKNVAAPLKNVAPIINVADKGLNRVELYTMSVYRGSEKSKGAQAVTNADTGDSRFVKPVDYIGKKSNPDYETYARKHIYNINVPGCATPGRLFVGQRKDPFVVNVAEIFDLVNLKDPLGKMDQGKDKDDLRMSNISSFIVELPITCVSGGKSVIGGWTTAEMPASRIGDQAFLAKDKQHTEGAAGEWVQVSRVGMPLVNEAVIGLKDKDRFNSSLPEDDAQFIDYVTNPTLPALLEQIFGAAGVKAPTAFPRADLVQAFLTGIPGLNANGGTSEMVRLNLTTPVTSAGKQSNLGVLGKDLAGFPNGRRPGDDVVDITLRVAMGALLPAADAPSGQLPFTDGAYIDSGYFANAFPYLRTPLTESPRGSATQGSAPAAQ